VYATCTTPRPENEGVVEAFLRERSDFNVAPPPEGLVRWNGLVTPEGYFRTFPDSVGETRGQALDGFFGARLVRRAA
jgi:16S rRNA (cytosine967-C5)-methyltransferase